MSDLAHFHTVNLINGNGTFYLLQCPTETGIDATTNISESFNALMRRLTNYEPTDSLAMKDILEEHTSAMISRIEHAIQGENVGTLVK